jgi:uncharacterized membrane protein YeaQ/YmgE (transglycosylase-associated protein family)
VLLFLIVLVISGFVIGGLARFALPGPDPMPWYATIGLGIAGAFLGGIAARLLIGTGGGFLFAFLGAVVLLYLYRKLVQGRGLTGPARSRP